MFNNKMAVDAGLGINFFLAILLWGLSCSLVAGELEVPKNDIVLTITGKISHFTSPGRAELDLASLEKLPATSFTSMTPWSEGAVKWEGVLLRDLLEFVGAQSSRFNVAALNDYMVVFDGVDLQKYPVIVAYKKDGEYMTVRNLGPLWIMFPFDDYPELKSETIQALSVWQLVEMELF